MAIDATHVVKILTYDEKTFFLQSVNIKQESTSFGTDIYIEALEVANGIFTKNEWKPLTFVTKSSILDFAVVLDSPRLSSIRLGIL